MNINYWDGYADPIPGNTNYADTLYYTGVATTYSTVKWVYSSPPKSVIIEHPEQWVYEDVSALVRLINIETTTEWRVEMLLNGDIIITDPEIDVREMKDFIPLLTRNASNDDKVRIRKFFEEHSI